MKPVLTLFLFLSFTLNNDICNAQGWQYAKFIKTINGGSDQSAVATDRSGNVFMAAYYWGSSVSIDSINLPGFINQDYMVVAKYDSIGNLLWAITSATGGSGYPINIICDGSGNLIIFGMCWSPLTWQGFSISDTVIHNKYFLAKINPAGSILWLKSVVDIDNTVAPSVPPISGGVAVDANGNIYVTGGLVDTVNNIEGHIFIGHGGADIFLNKYDSLGNLIWTKNAGGDQDDLAWSIATTEAGNIYITGSFSSDSLLFDSIKLFKRGGSGVGLGSIFITKYDNSGNVLWAKSSIGSGECTGVAADISENAYITGLSDSVVFDTYSCVGTNATFITKYNNEGTVIWVNKIEGTGPTLTSGIVVDGCNNVWTAADITVNTSVATDFPAMLVEYAPDGTLIESATIQSGYSNRHLAVDANRNIYMGSDVWLSITSGPANFNVGPMNYTITNDEMDGYLVKYVPDHIIKDTAYIHTDTAFCISSPGSLLAPTGYMAYRWNDDTWGILHPASGTTPYFVYCYPPTCASPTLVDTFSVRIDTLHPFSLGPDTSSCVPYYLLDPTTLGTYYWQDSSTADSYYVSTTGMYIFTDNQLTCTFADTILITIDSTPCEGGAPLMPDAFTPNGDGINDIIRPVYDPAKKFSDYTLSIFDRYGQLMFTTHEINKGWDGKINNLPAPTGVYLYELTYRAWNGKSNHIKSGNITLIR